VTENRAGMDGSEGVKNCSLLGWNSCRWPGFAHPPWPQCFMSSLFLCKHDCLYVNIGC